MDRGRGDFNKSFSFSSEKERKEAEGGKKEGVFKWRVLIRSPVHPSLRGKWQRQQRLAKQYEKNDPPMKEAEKKSQEKKRKKSTS